MIKDLFLYNFKRILHLFISFVLLITVYNLISIYSYYSLMLNDDYESFQFARLISDPDTGNSLINLLNNDISRCFMLLVPIVFLFMLIGRLVVKDSQEGFFIFVLSSNNSRTKLIISHILTFFVALLFINLFNFFSIFVICSYYFPGLLDFGAFSVIFITIFFIQFEFVAVMFFIGCFMDYDNTYFRLAAFIPICFFVLYVVSILYPKYEFLEKLTIFSLLDIDRILDGFIPAFTWLFSAISSILLFAVGSIHFVKKSISL